MDRIKSRKAFFEFVREYLVPQIITNIEYDAADFDIDGEGTNLGMSINEKGDTILLEFDASIPLIVEVKIRDVTRREAK